MPTRCIITGCGNTYKDGISFHRFPKDETIKKAWVKKVRLTRAKWKGPSASSSVCSEHFADSDFQDSGSYYTQFGMRKKKKLLKSTAIPNVTLGVKRSPKPQPTRSAWMKRERKRVLEEALSGVQTDQAPPHQSESEHEPGCSSWIEQTDTSGQSSQSAGTQTWVPTSSTGTQTCRSATSYAKRIQVSVQTRDAWTQYIALDVTGRSRGSLCDLSEEEKDQMDIEEAREEEKGAISSDFTPGGDSDPESSDSQSMPERPTQRLQKLQGERAPSVEVRHNRLIPPHEDTKYIVFETKLLDLFKLCWDCRSGNVCISKRLMGTLLIITVECYSCTSTNKWESQPFYQSRPAGNLLLSAATLFAGGSWTIMRRILSHLRLVCIADQTFYTIQRDILQPAIEC
ncbi:uncharacterized protein LOC132870278 [Neoarius graeffei]|uniref:uncharacterized protein LOC132870278 n=1 Tax=Neoarius graeffei TaxID=443677 RepID=UPI00298BF1F1|nr:uncharacterized protein LOC132870278 [Neoarius graeffei]